MKISVLEFVGSVKKEGRIPYPFQTGLCEQKREELENIGQQLTKKSRRSSEGI